MKLLEQKGASAEMIEGAKLHKCTTCELHKRPIGQPVSSVPRATQFNDRVQADTMGSCAWPQEGHTDFGDERCNDTSCIWP